jgi:hypothetical protein
MKVEYTEGVESSGRFYLPINQSDLPKRPNSRQVKAKVDRTDLLGVL